MHTKNHLYLLRLMKQQQIVYQDISTFPSENT